MAELKFFQIAEDLELAGLFWRPEIGDEIAERKNRAAVSILVDPQGLTPTELRSTYIWLPTFEQMILQLEARQGILCHAGFELTEQAMAYRTVIQTPAGQVESRADSIRLSMGIALRNFLLSSQPLAVN